MPSLRPNASSDQKQAAIDKGKEIFEEKLLHIWYELVQALDKKSVLFLAKLGMFYGKDLRVLKDPGCKN